MPLYTVLPGQGLDAAVRRIQRQAVLFYETAVERTADLPQPWPGAVSLIGETMALEAWDAEIAQWVPLGGGGTTPPVDDEDITVSPNPPTGGSDGDLWVQTTTTPWVAPPALPRGLISRVTSTAAEGAVVTATPVALARWTNVALVAGRCYRAAWALRAWVTAGVAGNVRMTPMAGQSAAVGMPNIDILPYVPSGPYGAGNFDTILVPTTTGTYSVGVDITSFGPNVTIYPGSAWFTIEDIGLA